MSSINCKVYKSEKKDGYYIYIEASSSLDVLPDELSSMLGNLVHVMDLELDSKRLLAQVNARDVINKINELGYFMQLPKEPLIW